METLKLKKLQKRGSVSSKNVTDTIVGLMVALILVTSFAPTIFTNSNLTGTGAPTWLITVLPILAGVALLYIILRIVKK